MPQAQQPSMKTVIICDHRGYEGGVPSGKLVEEIGADGQPVLKVDTEAPRPADRDLGRFRVERM